MKKSILFIIICFVGIPVSLFAQQRQTDENRQARFEQFKAEREAFLSEAMKLTDDEKKLFLPLCNELQMKKFELNKALREEMHKIRRARKENREVTEAEYKKLIELGSRIKLQEAQLEQTYIAQFLQILPAEKVFLYLKSEQDFGAKMIRERGKKE